MPELLDAIAGLLARFDASWPQYAGVFVRMGAIAFLAPGIGELSVPPRVRLAAAIALTVVVAPAAPAPAQAMTAAGWGAMLLAEAAAGLVIGFTLRLAVFVLQIFGAVTAQALSVTQLFGPGLGHDQESPIATIFIVAGLALACAGGLHVKLAVAAAETYAVIPFGGLADAGETASFITQGAARALSIAFGLAAPFVLLGMAYSAALAASNRAMPQMAAVFVGAPAIALAGLTLIAGASWAILARWSEVAAALFAAPLEGLP